MATLKISRQQAAGVLAAGIERGNQLVRQAELAERSGGYSDWISLCSAWREETVAELEAVYVERDIGQRFGWRSETSERSSPSYTFPHKRTALNNGIENLKSLIDRLELAVTRVPDPTAIDTLHPEILAKCRKLYESGDYAEAVEKGFKVVRDRLRTLTTFETGSEAFGKGGLHVKGPTAPHVDADFQEGVKFLTMAIDRFRNEKAHTSDGHISNPTRAYEYLRVSSLAMHLLD